MLGNKVGAVVSVRLRKALDQRPFDAVDQIAQINGLVHEIDRVSMEGEQDDLGIAAADQSDPSRGARWAALHRLRPGGQSW